MRRFRIRIIADALVLLIVSLAFISLNATMAQAAITPTGCQVNSVSDLSLYGGPPIPGYVCQFSTTYSPPSGYKILQNAVCSGFSTTSASNACSASSTSVVLCQTHANLYRDYDQDTYVSSTAFATNNCLEFYSGTNGLTTTQGNDCNDNSNLYHPGATEKCGDPDYNCDLKTISGANCLAQAINFQTSGCMSFGQNGYSPGSTYGCDATATNNNADTPWNCNANYQVSVIYGYVSAIKGADPTDTALALTAGEAFGAMKPRLLPALIPESKLLPPPGTGFYTACWPNVNAMSYQCGPDNPNPDAYRTLHVNTASSCSNGGTNTAPVCYNYFCGYQKSAYTCSNGGSTATDGYCRTTHGNPCASNNNCQSGAGSCVTKNDVGNTVNGNCCNSNEYSNGGTGVGVNNCRGLIPCSCSYSIYSAPGNYIRYCAAPASGYPSGTSCAQYNGGYALSPQYMTKSYTIG